MTTIINLEKTRFIESVTQKSCFPSELFNIYTFHNEFKTFVLIDGW